MPPPGVLFYWHSDTHHQPRRMRIRIPTTPPTTKNMSIGTRITGLSVINLSISPSQSITLVTIVARSPRKDDTVGAVVVSPAARIACNNTPPFNYSLSWAFLHLPAQDTHKNAHDTADNEEHQHRNKNNRVRRYKRQHLSQPADNRCHDTADLLQKAGYSTQ